MTRQVKSAARTRSTPSHGMQVSVASQLNNAATGNIAVQDGLLNLSGSHANIVNEGQIGTANAGAVIIQALSARNDGLISAADGAQVSIAGLHINAGALIAA